MSMLCGNCFREIEDDSAVHCPFCGHVLRNPAGTLPVGSILNGKYVVGSVTGQGPEGITYRGIVYNTRELVSVLEYVPTATSHRRPNGISVAPLQGCEELFSEGLKRFSSSSPAMAGCGGMSEEETVRDWFGENGTSYLVAADQSYTTQPYVAVHPNNVKNAAPPSPQSNVPASVAAPDVAQVRDDWSPVKVWLLSLVTFGIYGLYFYHNVAKGLNTMCWEDRKHTNGVGGLIGFSIITFGIYGFVWFYGVGERIRDNAPRFGAAITSGGGVLLGCIFAYVACLIFFAWVLPAIWWLSAIVGQGLYFLLYYYLVTSYVTLAKAYNGRQ